MLIIELYKVKIPMKKKYGIYSLDKIQKKFEDEIENNANEDVVYKYKSLQTYFNKTINWGLNTPIRL